MKRFVQEFMQRPFRLFTSNKSRLTLVVLLSMFVGGLALIKSYTGEGDKTLPEKFLSIGTDKLEPSWGTPSVDKDGNIIETDRGSGVKVRIGKDDAGNEIDWWIAKREEELLTLYSSKPVEYGPYNTYYKDLSPIGNYDITKANNWVTSAVRTFLGRNQGDFPGDMNSRTGSWDSTSGKDLSYFEKKYFTRELALKITPKTITTYGGDNNEFTSVDRFWLPLATGKARDSLGSALTLNTSAKFEDEVVNGDNNLIPVKYLMGNSIWTRTSFGNNEIYSKNGKLMEAVVTENKGYSPAMEFNIKDVKFISSVQANMADADGIFRAISIDTDGVYYLKYGYTGDAQIKTSENIETSSDLKIPYYLASGNAYLMAFMTNKDGGNVYYSCKNISAGENEEEVLNISNVPNGNYELKSWIEILEEGDRGVCIVSEIKTSMVRKGYKLTFEDAENVKFFNAQREELTGKSIIISDNKPFDYVASVDRNYNMSQLRTTLIKKDISELGTAINPSKVSKEDPYSDSIDDGVQPVTIGGGIITQGMDTVVYETTSAKNYWSYSISPLTSDVQVRTVGAEQQNEYKILLPTETQKMLSSLNINGSEYYIVENNSPKYTIDDKLNMSWLFNKEYYVPDMLGLEVKFVPKDWVEKLSDDSGEKHIVKESCKEQYKSLDKLECRYVLSSKSYSASSEFPDLNSDVYLFIEGVKLKQYNVSFIGSGSYPDIFSVGKLYSVENGNEVAISRAGLVKGYGESIRIRCYLDDLYDGSNSNLSIRHMDETTTSGKIYNSTNERYYYEWNVVIKDDSDINNNDYELRIESIEKKPNPDVIFNIEKFDNKAVSIQVDENFGRFNKAYNGSPYKFQIKPVAEINDATGNEEGYRWVEPWSDDNITVVPAAGKDGNEEEKYKTIVSRDSSGLCSVTIYENASKGITEPIEINISGLEEIPKVSTDIEVKLEDKVGGLDFYLAEELGFTEIPALYFGKEEGEDVSRYKTKVKSANFSFDKDATKATVKNDGSNYSFTLKGLKLELPIDQTNINATRMDTDGIMQASFAGSVIIDAGDQEVTTTDISKPVDIYFRVNTTGNDDEARMSRTGNVTAQIGDEKYDGKCIVDISGFEEGIGFDISTQFTVTKASNGAITDFTGVFGVIKDSEGNDIGSEFDWPLDSVMFLQNYLPKINIDISQLNSKTAQQVVSVPSVTFEKTGNDGKYKGDVTVNVSETTVTDIPFNLSKELYFNGAKKAKLCLPPLSLTVPAQTLKQTYGEDAGITAGSTLKFEQTSDANVELIASSTEFEVRDVDNNQVIGTARSNETKKSLKATVSVTGDLSVGTEYEKDAPASQADDEDPPPATFCVNITAGTVQKANISFSLGDNNSEMELAVKSMMRGDKVEDGIIDMSRIGADTSYIWVEGINDSKGFSAKKFSGDIETEMDSAFSNVFKISQVKSSSVVVISDVSHSLLRISSADGLDLTKMATITGKAYTKSSPGDGGSMDGLDTININSPGDLLIDNGKSFKLNITVDAEYDMSGMDISNATKQSDGSWIISDINSDMDIIISGIKEINEEFDFIYPSIPGLKVYDSSNLDVDVSGSIAKVKAGENKSVVLRKADGNTDYYFPTDSTGEYNFIKLTDFTRDNAQITNVVDFIDGEIKGYTIIVNSIKGNIELVNHNEKLLLINFKQFSVIFTVPDSVLFDYSVQKSNMDSDSRASDSGEIIVDRGDTVTFNIRKKEGYNYEKVWIKHVNSNGISEILDSNEDGAYTLNNIEADEGILVVAEGITKITNYIKFSVDNFSDESNEKLEDAVKIEALGRNDNFVNSGIPVYYGEDSTFYITLLSKYSDSWNSKDFGIEVIEGDVGIEVVESDRSKLKITYRTTGGVKSDIKIRINGLGKNKSTLDFLGENISVFDFKEGTEITSRKELNQGDFYKFYINMEEKYEINSVEAIRLNSTGTVLGTNIVRRLEGEEANGKENAYIIENLYGEVYINVTVRLKMYQINFEEGNVDLGSNKFKVKSVKGGDAQKINDKAILVPHGEFVQIVFEFTNRFDKFDGGKTGNEQSSGIGTITLEKSDDNNNISYFVKNRDTNDLQITGIFKENNTITLDKFEVNSYEITFPQSNKGYTIHSYVEGNPGEQIAEDTSQYVQDGEIYNFYIRPLGGGFDPDQSVVTIVSSLGERREMQLDPETKDKEYLLYTTEGPGENKDGGVYRDSSIEIEARKQTFTVKHEGYNVAFYSSRIGIDGEHIIPLENSKSNVASGDTWTFYVKANEGYDLSEATARTSTGTAIIDKGIVTGIPSDDDEEGKSEYRKYQIASVEIDTTVIIENVKLKEYRIQFEMDTSLQLPEELNKIITIYDDNGNKLAWDSNNKVIYGKTIHDSTFRFKYTLSEVYNRSKIKFIASVPSGESLGDIANYDVEYQEVNKSLINSGETITVKVGGITRNNYAVKFEGKGVLFDDVYGDPVSEWNELIQNQVAIKENEQYIQHDTGELVFRVRENVEYGYSIDDKIDVRASNGSISFVREGNTANREKFKEYNLSDVTADTIINVTGAKSVFYTIDFKTDLNDVIDSTETLPEGLKILDTDGRDISGGIRSTNGSNLKFSIELNAEYTNLKPKISGSIEDPDIKYYTVYKDWGKTSEAMVIPQNGYYTISGINANSTIMIEGIKGNKNRYKVDFVKQGDMVEFWSVDSKPISENDKIEIVHGEGSYTFVVKPGNGYELSEAIVTSTNSNVTQSIDEADPKNLKVTLTNVTDDTRVVVNNITLTLYSVQFNILGEDGEKIDETAVRVRAYGTDRDITAGTQVYYKKDLEFKVVLGDGYTQSPVEVYWNGGDDPIKPTATGYYQIRNVSGGITVDIKGIKKNSYSVRLIMDNNDVPNVTLKHLSGDPIQPNVKLDNVVRYGESFGFRIEANNGYNLDKLSVTTKDADVSIEPTIDKNTLRTISAKVTLANVKGNLDAVNIGGINKDMMLVSFSGTENIWVYDENAKDITSTGKEVAYRGNMKFTLAPHEGYDRGKNNWVVSYEIKDKEGNAIDDGVIGGAEASSGQMAYELNNIVGNVNIVITGVEINIYDIVFNGNHVKFCNSVTDKELVDGDKKVSHGGYYNFKIKPDEGYDLLNMGISADVGDLSEESRTENEAIYTLSNIINDVTINVLVDQSKVEVTFIPGTGVIYQDEEAISELTGKQTITYGKTLKFTVRALEGYDINTLKVKQGDKELTYSEATDEYKKFTTTELKADYDISTTIEKKKYSITVPNIEGVSFYENEQNIKGGESVIVRYGDSFKFRIALDDKHNQSEILVKSNVKIQSNGQEIIESKGLAAIDGFYTITEISNNIEISVENVEINRYKINLAESTGIQYNSGDDSQKDIKGIHVVSHGDTFSFRISPLEGYELSNMVVTVQEEDGSSASITPSGGVYAITNIRGNKTINVADSAMIQYKVTFAPADGVIYSNDTGDNIYDPIMVTHGNNFEFSISIADAYDDSIPLLEITSSKSQISKLSTGRYIISNVTEDMTVKTLNVTKNRYTVTLKEITGVMYKSMDGRILKGDQYVEHEGSFQFKVDLYPAYTDSSITAMLGKDEIKPESDGSFLITGILENKTVTVTGVEENPEVRVINMINALRDSIRDASDVDAVVAATKAYNQLSDTAKARVTNIDKLLGLQKESGTFIHTTNDITVEGVNWHIKLVAVPLSASSEEMGRVYNKLSTEFILSLYDIYLWDMMAEKKYTLPEGEKVKVSIPTPDLTYFKDTFIVHEKSSDGKLEYLTLNIEGDTTWFEMTSFSPVGMAAKRKVETTHSSFFDTIGANVDEMKKVLSNTFGSKKSSASSSGDSDKSKKNSSNGQTVFGDDNIDEKFKQGNGILAQWSALRLLLVLIIGFIVSVIITLIVKKRRSEPKESDKFEVVDHVSLDSEEKNNKKDKNKPNKE